MNFALPLPNNIYNFTIHDINNSLPTSKNMTRWGLSQSPDFSFYLNPESLFHFVAGCQHYLDHFTWSHDSILNLPTYFDLINDGSSLYANYASMTTLPLCLYASMLCQWFEILSPSIISGDNYLSDLIFLIQSKCLYTRTSSWFRF